jgi:accessory colonization factor AcfC
MRAFILTALAAMTIAAPAYAGPVHVFGPGGPAPAMKEAAATFSKLRGVKVEVVAGPTSDWIDAAKQSGDVIYSGSETMMTDLQLAMGDRIDPTTVTPLYLRVSNILVRERRRSKRPLGGYGGPHRRYRQGPRASLEYRPLCEEQCGGEASLDC